MFSSQCDVFMLGMNEEFSKELHWSECQGVLVRFSKESHCFVRSYRCPCSFEQTLQWFGCRQNVLVPLFVFSAGIMSTMMNNAFYNAVLMFDDVQKNQFPSWSGSQGIGKLGLFEIKLKVFGNDHLCMLEMIRLASSHVRHACLELFPVGHTWLVFFPEQ